MKGAVDKKVRLIRSWYQTTFLPHTPKICGLWMLASVSAHAKVKTRSLDRTIKGKMSCMHAMAVWLPKSCVSFTPYES